MVAVGRGWVLVAPSFVFVSIECEGVEGRDFAEVPYSHHARAHPKRLSLASRYGHRWSCRRISLFLLYFKRMGFDLYSAVRCCLPFQRIWSSRTPDSTCMPCMGVVGENGEVYDNHYRPCAPRGHDTRTAVGPVLTANWEARPWKGSDVVESNRPIYSRYMYYWMSRLSVGPECMLLLSKSC